MLKPDINSALSACDNSSEQAANSQLCSTVQWRDLTQCQTGCFESSALTQASPQRSDYLLRAPQSTCSTRPLNTSYKHGPN